MILYIFVFLGFTFIASPIVFISQFDSNIIDPRVWEETFYMFSTFALWSGWIYAMAVLSVCIFYAEISNNIGQGVLNNFLTGKYHKPIEEERIFMFLDMKSSTTIAEQLGHVKYFELLSEYYSDFTEAIINSSGEIYQYIGDEVVVSWETTKGIRNNNCLECFRMMKKSLKKRTDFYKDKFGVVPSFKAGMHVGLVTCGEIGVLKKEIIFTGDILNTTARIQSLCNEYEVDLIISESLIKQLDLKKEHPIQALGENELRGRMKHINLYSLNL